MHSLSRLSILMLSGAQSIRESSGIVCESAVPAERTAKSKTGGKPEEKVGYWAINFIREDWRVGWGHKIVLVLLPHTGLLTLISVSKILYFPFRMLILLYLVLHYARLLDQRKSASRINKSRRGRWSIIIMQIRKISMKVLLSCDDIVTATVLYQIWRHAVYLYDLYLCKITSQVIL